MQFFPRPSPSFLHPFFFISFHIPFDILCLTQCRVACQISRPGLPLCLSSILASPSFFVPFSPLVVNQSQWRVTTCPINIFLLPVSLGAPFSWQYQPTPQACAQATGGHFCSFISRTLIMSLDGPPYCMIGGLRLLSSSLP